MRCVYIYRYIFINIICGVCVSQDYGRFQNLGARILDARPNILSRDSREAARPPRPTTFGKLRVFVCFFLVGFWCTWKKTDTHTQSDSLRCLVWLKLLL